MSNDHFGPCTVAAGHEQQGMKLQEASSESP
jgi:hypothetical protein